MPVVTTENAWSSLNPFRIGDASVAIMQIYMFLDILKTSKKPIEY
jgi:hypothetical protein